MLRKRSPGWFFRPRPPIDLAGVLPGAVLGIAAALFVACGVAQHARERIDADAGRIVFPIDGGDDCDRACANLLAKGCTVRASCVVVCRQLDVAAREERGVAWDPACIANAADRESMHVCGNVPICERR